MRFLAIGRVFAFRDKQRDPSADRSEHKGANNNPQHGVLRRSKRQSDEHSRCNASEDRKNVTHWRPYQLFFVLFAIGALIIPGIVIIHPRGRQ